MQYLSVSFVVFVAFVWCVYCIIPQKNRWKVLLSSSLIFYLLFDVKYIFFLLFVAFSTFVGAKYIGKSNNKAVLAIVVGSNVIVWFVVKVLPWCGTIFNSVIRNVFPGRSVLIPDFIVPVGISYYVLMAISYLVDVYKGKIEEEKSFAKYLLYLSYFPTIIQGPISRYDMLRQQLCAGKRIEYQQFRYYMLMIAFGITKKMVIADRVALVANDCFNNYTELQGLILYVGAIFYAIQIYMDFSSCVDICRGVSGLFGIELIDNFNAPYFSKSIKEFWSKWHISLSSWLKDYVYIPLGGNRKGKTRKYCNLLITFIVSGIWHGAGFSFLAWGLLHSLYQIIGEVTIGIRKKIRRFLKIEEDSISERIYQTIITFNLVTFAWIFFRADTYAMAIEYIQRMFCNASIDRLLDASLFVPGMSYAQSTILIFNLVIVSLMDYYRSKKGIDVKEMILNSHFIIRWSIYFIMIYNITLFGVYGKGYDVSSFLYGGF